MSAFNLKNFNSAAKQQPILGMLIYSIVGFIRPAIYIFLLPLYLNVFSEVEYAIYDLMMITAGLLMVFATFRLNAAMLTQYYDYYKDEALKHRFLSSLFTTSIFFAVCLIIIGYFFGELAFSAIFSSEEVFFFPYGFYILIYAALSEINNVYFIFLKNEKYLSRYLFVVLFQILMVILLQFICIIFLKMGVEGAFVGMLIANVLTTLLILVLQKNILTLRPDGAMIRVALKFSVALIPYLLIYWGLTKGGKLVLEHNAELGTVGIFAVLMTIAGIVIIVVEATINAVRPFLFDTFAARKQEDDKNKINLFNRLIILLPLLCIPVLILVATNIGLVTSKESYSEIARYITLASFVSFLLVYSKMFYQQIIFVKRSDILTSLSFVVLIVMVVCLFVFVPTYKIWGVLIAMLLANIVMAVLFYNAAQKRLPVHYNKRQVFLIPTIFFAILFCLEWVCIQYFGSSYAFFGVIQFLILTSSLLLMNIGTVSEYKKLFVIARTD